MILLGLVLWGQLCSAGQYDYLTDNDLIRIRSYMTTYTIAAECVGVPVLALPAIHCMESDLCGVKSEVGCRGPVCCMGGPFMLDCGGLGKRFDDNIRWYEKHVAALYFIEPAPRVRDNFQFAAICAARELKDKARGPLFDRHARVNMDVLADAMWGYNGRAGKVWWRSAYVNNHPKAGRNLTITIKMADGSTTRYIDDRPGAIVLYREIKRRL